MMKPRRKTCIEMLAVALLCFAFLMPVIGHAQTGDSDNGKVKMRKVKVQTPEDNKPPLKGAPLEYVKMITNQGDIFLELNREKAPISVANFLNYVDKDFYDSTIFHRVINGFMIQGGGFTVDMNKKPTGPPIENEWQNGLKNLRGTIAMARRGGQANSATSQFFINVNDNKALDVPRDGSGYAVFGHVIDGMNVVDKIKAVRTHKVNGRGNVPVDPVVILDVVRIEKPAPKEK